MSLDNWGRSFLIASISATHVFSGTIPPMPRAVFMKCGLIRSFNLDSSNSTEMEPRLMMRHSSITTTANYGDTVPADLRQAHERVVQRALQHGNGTEGSATH